MTQASGDHALMPIPFLALQWTIMCYCIILLPFQLEAKIESLVSSLKAMVGQEIIIVPTKVVCSILSFTFIILYRKAFCKKQ